MKIIFILLVVGFISGCASSKVVMSAADLNLKYNWQPVEIDRYEPVIFPAGRLE